MKHETTLRGQNFLLTRLLKKLGNERPTQEHITFMGSLLSRTVVEYPLTFTDRLTGREISCLLLAAKGMTSSETAELLGIKSSTVETYRKKIKQKLVCNTMAQAVFEGIRFGYMNPKFAAGC